MYLPASNQIEDVEAIRAFAAAVGTGLVITVDAQGRASSTLLPIIWEGDVVIAHFARQNDHWQQIREGSEALLVIGGPGAYISPSWYAAKVEHGRVVPTWNYSEVQLRGAVSVHDDTEWLRDAVTRLTDTHEQSMPTPWAVTDAPEAYVAGMLRAIVGISVQVSSVEAKAKWSQNRSAADREGVVAGLKDPGSKRRVSEGTL